jgi:heat-inducible transcriptional repressor
MGPAGPPAWKLFVTINLSPRSESVLKTLIETYLVQGEPVGSRLLSKLLPGSLSSATIRNVLADLEDATLVHQPHTSAGRVPTEKAYRYYVDRWVKATEPGPAMGARLSAAFEGMGDPEGEAQWVRHASKVLSEAMEGICVALPIHLATSRMVRLEFVSIGAGKLVTVWVGTDGEVEHQVMDNIWAFSNEVLVELGNFASAHFAGCSLREMRDRLIAAVEEQVDQNQRRLSAVAHRMVLPPQRGGSPVVAGLGILGRIPEFGDASRFRELVDAFEQHERLAHLLNAFAQAATREVQLLLGTENPYFNKMPLATALRTVTVRRNQHVTFALVGPLRMDYVKLVGSLAWWSDEIQRREPSSA